MKKQKYSISVTVTIDEKFIDEVLVTGAEHIGYWCNRLYIDSQTGHAVIDEVLDEGLPREGANLQRHRITFGAIASALGGMVSGINPARADLVEHARRAVLDNQPVEIDAELADVIIQYALFGRIVYG